MTKETDVLQDPTIEENTPELNGSGEVAVEAEEIQEIKHVDMKILIDGKEVIAPPPKMKLLRTAIRLGEKHQSEPNLFNTEAGIDLLYELIRMIFNNQELTNDVLDESDLSNVYSLSEVNIWINQYFNSKNFKEAMEVNTMRENQSERR